MYFLYFVADDDKEPLSARLASLRMQLEEKRRQFEEEKRRKQKTWDEERAKVMQDAFWVLVGGKQQAISKESEAPGGIDPTKSWEIRMDQHKLQQKVRFEMEIRKKSLYSVYQFADK